MRVEWFSNRHSGLDRGEMREFATRREGTTALKATLWESVPSGCDVASIVAYSEHGWQLGWRRYYRPGVMGPHLNAHG